MSARQLRTNFSKGELSPLMEGRPDLAPYFEGTQKAENWYLLRQGGLDRRPGLRMLHEIKDVTKDTILLPFEASVDDAFEIEVGDLYMRFYKNKQLIMSGGTPVEVVSPYGINEIRIIHFTQSVDVMFIFHPNIPQHTLSRVSDTQWVLAPAVYPSPPSFEDDTNISGGASVTAGAATGTDIAFVASSAIFLEGDVGRVIISGTSQATITGFGESAGDTTSPNTTVRASITTIFPLTAIHNWKLKLSPQSDLDVDKKQPVGTIVNGVAAKNAFRAADVGKFIAIWGGVIKITTVTDAKNIIGEILSILGGTDEDNPENAVAGSWTLEVSSWSPINGYPRTGEFYSGRQGQASTPGQPTSWWLSAPDDFYNYAVGTTADRAVDFTMAAKRLNRIEWLADNRDLFIGTTGSEHRAQGGKSDEPIGGDSVPLVRKFGDNGSAPIQPATLGRQLIHIDRSRRKVFAISFDIEQDDYEATELTGASEHITDTGIRLGPLAVAFRPDPRLYFVREDGTLITLTYFKAEKVVGFTRLITDGAFEAVCAIPKPSGNRHDEVAVIVRRTINGQIKRFVEIFEDEHESLVDRKWKSLQTDCSGVYRGAPVNTITDVDWLIGETVQVIADGSYIGTRIVSSIGEIALDDLYSEVEFGLPYISTMISMRPAIQNQVIEGLERTWSELFVRLYNTIGGHVNGQPIVYEEQQLIDMFSGDKKLTDELNWDTERRVTVEQRDPYPMTLLSVFGELQFGGS